MKKIKLSEYYEISKRLAGTEKSNIILSECAEEICIGVYVNNKNKSIYIPAYENWNLNIENVIKYKLYVYDGYYYIPVKEDETIIQHKEFQDFYIAILREETTYYILELFHNSDLIFSRKLESPFVKFGVDLKIIYSTKEKENFVYWVYKDEKHIKLYESTNIFPPTNQYNLNDSNRVSILNGDNIELIFHYKCCKKFYISEYFAKNYGDSFEILPNPFTDNDTQNYKVTFKKDRYEDIAFMQYCIQPEIQGYAIYGVEISEIRNSCMKNISEISFQTEMSMLWTHIEFERQCREILKHIYEVMGMEVDLYHMPNLPYFDRGIEQIHATNDYLKPYIESIGQINWNAYKKKYDSIYDELVKLGLVEPKWKSEYDLYKIAKGLYPDTIYQYRASWLGFQSLDIFIPCIRLGIEYQGIQHYKPVSLFGGEEAFEYRKKLDEKKFKLCETNKVKLLYWRYDEKISKILFENRIRHFL